MNNKAQTLMLSLLFPVVIFIFGILFINFLIPDVDTARTALSCSSPSIISDGTKVLCLITDGVVPYFILIVLSLSGGVVLDRLLI